MRSLPKRSCTQASTSASVTSPKPPKSSSGSDWSSSADIQSRKRKKKQGDAAEAPAAAVVPAAAKKSSSFTSAHPHAKDDNEPQASMSEHGQITLDQFGFPVVSFTAKASDIEIVDRSRDSSLSLYGFSQPKFKPKICIADSAAPLIQSDILKFCVNNAKPFLCPIASCPSRTSSVSCSCILNIDDSPEHGLAAAAADAIDAAPLDGNAAAAVCVLPAKRVRKPDSSPETLEEHRRLIYHQLRMPAMCHEDVTTGKQVFRCAGHIVRHFVTSNQGGLKMFAKKMGLDFNRLADKSFFWGKKHKPLFPISEDDITHVLRLGTVEGTRPCFSFDGYVYPAGFLSRFMYTSHEDNMFDNWYQFGIVDCKLCPLFYMVSETYDVARYYSVASSPAELWEAFEKFLHNKFDDPIREAAFEEIFGFGLPVVVAQIGKDIDGDSLNVMVKYAKEMKEFTRHNTLQELNEDEWLDDDQHPFYLNSRKAAAPRELSAHQKAVMRSRQKKPETDSEDDDPVELRVEAGQFLWHGKPGFQVEDLTLKFRRPVLEQFTGCKIKEQDALDLPDSEPEPVVVRSTRQRPCAPVAPIKKLEFIRELPRVQAQALKVGAALPMNSTGSARTQPYIPMTFLQKLPFITMAERHLPKELSSSICYGKISDTER